MRWVPPLLFSFFCGLLVGVVDAEDAMPPKKSLGQSVPFHLRGGRAFVPVKLNHTEAASFLLDTGFTMTMLREEYATRLGLKTVGQVTIAGIAGDERTEVVEGLDLDLGSCSYAPRRTALLKGKRTHPGILGSGFFKKFVVLLNCRDQTLTLYDPAGFQKPAGARVIPMRFRNTTPIISASILSGTNSIEAEFEIDTGCDGGLCLGERFIREHHLLEGAGETEAASRRGFGGGATTRAGFLSGVNLAGFTVKKPGTNFFLEGSPAAEGLAGHIGMEILSKFEITFDYSRKELLVRESAPGKLSSQ